ncbi:hypothetical protein LOAG_18765 [Loa loa]|uniref:Uncharacterized protein n=1 Tax=Loa loa TaxID=7209 RepID=A0A1S0UEI0_LOALO|nr:hypothetical protein LOAG_18765 [Loa loa]EJD73841.1 hypothetical protein LOAG_18765 [Loa loa]
MKLIAAIIEIEANLNSRPLIEMTKDSMQKTNQCLNQFGRNGNKFKKTMGSGASTETKFTERKTEINEVVTVMKEEQPKGTRMLGIIEGVKSGGKGAIRSATV